MLGRQEAHSRPLVSGGGLRNDRVARLRPELSPVGLTRTRPHARRRRDTRVMAYDEVLAGRLRAALQGEPGLTEKRMFGGLAFLLNGNMAVGASGQGGLLLRVDPADTATLIAEPQVRRMEMGGRQMDGWLRIETTAVETDEALRQWVERGVGYTRTLPPK
jgi:TfoX/Sxy family transcriptional regulator of competence genes